MLRPGTSEFELPSVLLARQMELRNVILLEAHGFLRHQGKERHLDVLPRLLQPIQTLRL
jgi:hypothetical protein